MLNTLLIFLAGLISGVVIGIATHLGKVQIDHITEIKRLVVCIGRELEKIEKRGVGFGPQPTIEEPARQLEEKLPLSSWYWFLGLLHGLQPQRQLAKVNPLLMEYLRLRNSTAAERLRSRNLPDAVPIRKYLRIGWHLF